MARADVISLLAQYHKCPVDAMTAIWDQTLAAFRQAMAEFGIGEHPDGKCPESGCQCCSLEPLVTARAFELLGIEED